ncbi:MAG: ABC transporter permease subunit/CPBP intramembrane protease [Planctomycetota bacterium]
MNAKIRAIYIKELTDALRDRRTLFATAIIPLLIYPLMTLGMAEVAQMAKAKLDREDFPVAVLPGTQASVERVLSRARATNEPLRGLPVPEIKTDKPPPKKKESATPKTKDASPSPVTDEDDSEDDVTLDTFQKTQFSFREMPLEEARKALAAGTIRAVLSLPATFENDIGALTIPAVAIEYDQAERVSLSAFTRLRAMLERYESAVVKERLKTRALPAGFLHPFTLDAKNTAVAAKLGGSTLGGILPLIFIIMLMTGALHPAIDMTAGEKERSTLETLAGAPVRPLEIITGKFLAVATLSLGNAVLNVLSFAISIALLPLPATLDFQFPWSALPLTLTLLVPLALFFSALLLMVASFAANTKEAQVFCMPVFLIPTVGMAIAMTPGIELQGPLLLTPIVNTALLIKELFLFHGTTQQFAFVFVSTCLYAAGMVTLAARVFAREEVMFSAQGSLRLFLSRRFFKESPTPRPGDVLMAAALLFPLNFYVSLWLQKMLVLDASKPIEWSVLAALVIVPQYGLFLAGPLWVSTYLKANWKTTFQWNRPSLNAVIGAALMGCSSWLIAIQLITWQSRVWSFGSGDMGMEHALKQLSSTALGQGFLIFLIALTPAICEEHFFRGFFQQGLGRKNKWATIVLVGAVFGFFHFPVFRMPVTAVLGMVMAFTAWQTRSIWPGVLMHFLHNGLSLVGPGLLKLGGDETKSGAAAFPIIPQSYFGIAVVSFVLGLMLVSRAGKHAVAVIEPTSETTFSNRSST